MTGRKTGPLDCITDRIINSTGRRRGRAQADMGRKRLSLQIPTTVIKNTRGLEPSFSPVAEERPSMNKQFSRSSSLCGDASPNTCQFYEVLFLGKIKASHKRAPPTFIDEAVVKFRQRELKNSSSASAEPHAKPPPPDHPTLSAQSSDPLTTPLPPSEQDRSVASISVTSHSNRTMLLQVGKNDLRLISPDKKQVLLHKSFREISHCSSGQSYKEHFGFICREGGGSSTLPGYLGYVFRCDSAGVVEDIMLGLKSAFQTAHEQSKQIDSCKLCPMVWFNSLCSDLEGLTDCKAQSLLLNKIEKLDQNEKDSLMAKMSGAETSDLGEQNQVLMMLLKASCEVRQTQHRHLLSTPSLTTSSQTPNILVNSDVSGLSEVAKRAKRSLADSFSGIIGRKASLDMDNSDTPLSLRLSDQMVKPTPAKMPHPLSVTNAERRLMVQEKSVSPEKRVSPNKTMDPLTPDKHSQFQCEVGPNSPGMAGSTGRHRAKTVGSAGGETMKRELARRRLAMLKEEKTKEEKTEGSSLVSIFAKTAGGKSPSGQTAATQRQQIFQRVVTPGKSDLISSRRESVRHKEPRNYGELWRNGIRQQILLNRMERENRRMLEHEEQLAERRLKLDYTDLSEPGAQELAVWERILGAGTGWKDRPQLRDAVAKGIPQSKRGEAWQLLSQLRETLDSTKEGSRESSVESQLPTASLPYIELKSRLTSHQHAILIDLGRTFPSHAYFCGALGPGQLGLFNLLKAYSILDPEVGYCQGLPFSAGLLLMHMEEEEAFLLLRHLLVREGLRDLFNPDMTGLQLSMYKLTRLLAETHPRIYRQLDLLQVDPSLYATPWFLTLFAAHFPLGFVARVFDLLFLEGGAAIIKVAVCLLVECEEEILVSDSLEEVMEVFKGTLPSLPPSKLEDVVRQAASLNIRRQLHTYEVEYQVLQEEQAAHRVGVQAREVEVKEEVDRLASRVSDLVSQLEEKEKLVVSLSRQLADKDLLIQRLVSQQQGGRDRSDIRKPCEEEKVLIEDCKEESL